MLKLTGVGLISATLLLAGCGGGGGGGSSSGLTYDGPTAAVVINSESEADTLAGTIIGMETGSSSLLGDATGLVLGAAVSTEGSGSFDMDAIGKITRKLSKRAFTSEPTPDMLAGVTQSDTQQCDPYRESAGTHSVSVTLINYDDINGWTPTNGDSFSMTFSNCFMLEDPSVPNIGEIINGSISMVLTDVSGFDPYAFNPSFSARYTFTNLSALDTATSDKVWMHGAFSAGFSGDGSSSSPLTFSFSGNSLIVQQLSGGITESAQLSNFSFSDTMYTNGDFILDHDYTIASTEIGGSVTVVMDPALNFVSGANYPSTGVVEVTFANGHVRLTALDNTQVYIEYDLDGVEGYELNQTKLWTDL